MRTPCSRSKVLYGVRGKAGKFGSGDKLALNVGREQAATRIEAIKVRGTAWCKPCEMRAAQHFSGVV